MAILKCKMCGGDLSLVEGESTAKCEYCGSVQTVPKTDDEKKLVLFERAERLRRLCEFDKAAGIYEAIVADFRQEAEAYWGLVLCKYGIEYVDDPATAKKIPTCHRSSFESIMEDGDFEQALENADTTARGVYRKEAKQIEEIRKGIIAVSANEEPYDIFICYKETDEKGERTLDSVLAQDVYDALTDKGYRVFFSRITLEDKLGVEYEPYIFAALNSAKIMLAFGTDYEYFNAVWVKNEWGRFLKLMTKDKEKHLIPCFKGIDAYDMPREFAKLQAQDMGKVGAMQDLLRGVGKLLPQKKEYQSQAVSSTKKHTISKRIRYILIALFCAALVFSAIYLGTYAQNTETAKKDYDELANLREDILTTAPSTQTPPTTPNENSKPPSEVPSTTPDDPHQARPPIEVELKEVYALNNDLVGWIDFNDESNIDLPVMQSPYDEDFYLEHKFNKEPNGTVPSGAPYVPLACNVFEPSDNVIIYGQNIKNVSMFGSLTNYTDKAYWENHQTFTFDTLYERHTYQIFAVYRTAATQYTESGEVYGYPYEAFSDFVSEEEFNKFVIEVKGTAFTTGGYKGNTYYETGITPKYGDKLLSLVTPEYTMGEPSEPGSRLVVMAVRIS